MSRSEEPSNFSTESFFFRSLFYTLDKFDKVDWLFTKKINSLLSKIRISWWTQCNIIVEMLYHLHMSSVKRRVADADAGFHIEHLDGDGRRYVGWTRQKLDIPLSLIKLFIIQSKARPHHITCFNFLIQCCCWKEICILLCEKKGGTWKIIK